MNFVEYSPFALRTLKQLETSEQQIDHAWIGMFGECGEISDNVKRHVIGDKPFNPTNLMEECGDAFWYLNLWMVEKGLPLSLVDDVYAHLLATPAEERLPYYFAQDKWHLLECTKVLPMLLVKLNLSSDEREGEEDAAVVQAFVAVLVSFLDCTDFDLSHCLQRNIEKLKIRHGDKYNDFNFESRDIEAEQKVLSA